MGKRPAAVSWIATHAVAAGLGLGVWWGWKAEKGGGVAAEGNGVEARDFRSSRRTERDRGKLSGDELLTRMTGIGPEGRAKEERLRDSERMMRRVEELLRRADEVEPADDVAGAAMGAMEKLLAADRDSPQWGKISAEAQVRMLHWLREDPKAALATNFKRLDKTGTYNGVLSAAVKEKGILAAAEWLSVNPMADTELRTSFSFLAGAEADLGILDGLRDKVPPARGGDMRTMMAYSWPLEKGNELLAFAKEEKAPAFVMKFVETQGKEGFAWLRKEMAAGTIDPELQAMIVKRPEYRSLYLSSSEVPLEERIGVMRMLDPNQEEGVWKHQIGLRDVTSALGSGRDWRYAFRHGAATFEEIEAEVFRSTPELAKSDPELVRSYLLNELAEENASAALAVWDRYPAEEKWLKAAQAARSTFYNVNPQEFYDFVSRIPGETNEGVWNQRLAAWAMHGEGNYRRLGDGYVDWVLTLPQGIDREMASYALYRNVREKNPTLAETLRGEIRDPMLQAKMEEGK